MSQKNLIQIIILTLLCAVFVFHAVSLSFTQDDAFISYRYVKNFLNGDGLVFNPGERVEGYTNLFFIFLMIFLGRLGIDIIIASKIIGVASGVGTIVLSFFWMRKLLDSDKDNIIPLTVPLLLIANEAFAYWAISGMETLLFTFLILLGLYLVSEKKTIYIAVMAIATLTRPEGGLIMVAILTYNLYAKNISFASGIGQFMIFVLLILPQLVFRYLYYGDILPNPFYAKTGLAPEYFFSGVKYIVLFMSHYGLYGGILIIPILAYRYFTRQFRLILFISIIFTLYILLIGGDVLNCFRFFIPILTLLYMLLVASIVLLTRRAEKLKNIGSNGFIVALVAVIGLFSYIGSDAHIEGFLVAERGLVNKMTHQAFIMKPVANKNKLIASSTIGAFSYYSDARVIDLLGLTDKYIAHHPLAFKSIESTWKERNYNIPYVMGLDPDFILFSTSMKPSAPAEKALFLSSEFREAYYPVFGMGGGMKVIYKRRPDYSGEDSYIENAQFVDLFARALNGKARGEKERAFDLAIQSIAKAPDDFYLPLSILGEIQLENGKPEEAVVFFDEAIRRSHGYATLSTDYLAQYYEAVGDTASAEPLYKTLLQINRLD